MDAPQPDFGIVERTWERRLRDRGLVPSRIGTGIAAGHQRLELHRQETQVAEFDVSPPAEHGFVASLQVKIVLDPPDWGNYEVYDLVTQPGPSMEGALEACANTFMDVTFPPIETLFTQKRPEGPGTGSLTLTSFTIGRDRAVKWDVVIGQLQILNDAAGEVRARLKSQPPVTLILETLTGYLAEPRLHWVKLYAAKTRSGGAVFGCAINGHKSPQAEAEMSCKFGDPPPGDWEFRQFLVVRPLDDADQTITEELRARAAEAFPERKKSWWSRIIGRAT